MDMPQVESLEFASPDTWYRLRTASVFPTRSGGGVDVYPMDLLMADKKDTPTIETTTEARGGVTGQNVRYFLAFNFSRFQKISRNIKVAAWQRERRGARVNPTRYKAGDAAKAEAAQESSAIRRRVEKSLI